MAAYIQVNNARYGRRTMVICAVRLYIQRVECIYVGILCEALKCIYVGKMRKNFWVGTNAPD